MTQEACLVCDRTSAQVPLLKLKYQDQEAWICPQHLPVLIHKPSQLADKLPGLDQLTPAPHEH